MAPKIALNKYHHQTGDPKPAYNGKLRVYGMRYCPFVQRTILTLLSKQLDFEVVNVKILNIKPEWLTEMNPFGTVPIVEAKEGQYVYESLVTVDFLEEAYPERSTLAKDPFRRATDRIIVEANKTVISFFYKVLRTPESVTESHVEEYHKALSFIEDHLASRGTKFFGGQEPGYPDYMIWPWLERINFMKNVYTNLRIDPKLKILTQYIKDMLNHPIIKECLVPEHAILEFYRGYLKLNANYTALPEDK